MENREATKEEEALFFKELQDAYWAQVRKEYWERQVRIARIEQGEK